MWGETIYESIAGFSLLSLDSYRLIMRGACAVHLQRARYDAPCRHQASTEALHVGASDGCFYEDLKLKVRCIYESLLQREETLYCER